MYFYNSKLLWLFLLIPVFSHAQIRLKGVVIDKTEREPLPFCNILIPQLNEGFVSDENGEFDRTFTQRVDSAVFSYLGYKPQTIGLKDLRTDDLTIELEPISNELEEFIVYAPKKRQKDTIAWRIYSNVVANKPVNRPTSHEYLEYEEYEKTIGSFYNFSPKLINRKLIRPFKFVLENYDTTADGRRYVPLILKEEITQHSYQKEPKKEKTLILATKTSGIEQAQVSDLLKVAFDEMDAYSNDLTISGKSFMLPFAEGAWFKYRFYVIDSTENDSCEWIYHIGFSPINKGDMAFVGEALIHQPTYAIQRIELNIDRQANINWISDFLLHQEFSLIDGRFWVKTKDRRTTGVTLTQRKKSKMLHLEQVKTFSKIRIDQPIEDSVFNDKRVFVEDYRKKDNYFWDTSRHELLRPSHKNVYFLIDSVKNTKAYKRYLNFGRTIATGFYKIGPVDIGNLYNFLSYNNTEGFRIRLSTRSNRDLSKKFWYVLYGAYGTNDNKYKYGVTLKYRFPNDRSLINELGIIYKDDYQRFSLANNPSNEYDYILNAFLRRRAFTDLVYVKDFSAYYKKQWNNVVTTEFYADYRKYKTVPGHLEFTTTLPDGSKEVVRGFNLASPRLVIELTPGAQFLQAEGKKFLLKGRLPRFYIDLSMSSKHLLGSDFNYQKAGIRIEQRLPSPIGWTRYILSASKLFGEIPYPLLHIHEGNENFIIDHRRFANMREGEYAADQQVSLFLEHHFDGFFLNRVPLVKKLKWREVFIYKMAYSSLSEKKTGFLDLPATMKGLNGFYSEIGFGFENVFKVFKGQFTWRLTQKDDPNVSRFVFRVACNPSF